MLQPLEKSRFRIPKSRYDSVSAYISESPKLLPEYNNKDLVIDQDIKDELMKNGSYKRCLSVLLLCCARC